MEPAPSGLVNSTVSMPMRVNSIATVGITSGDGHLRMLPSFLLRGRRKRRSCPLEASAMAAGRAPADFGCLDGHLATPLAHLHDQGKSTPTGTLFNVKLPLESVSAVVMGLPDTEAEQVSQEAPVEMAASGASGT